MNPPTLNPLALDVDRSPAEATLRLIAALPAPQGLEERVQARLNLAPGTTPMLARPAALGPPHGWMRAGWVRAAAAAAIASAVAGGGWGVYSRVEPMQRARTTSVAPGGAAPAGFSSAGAMRLPQTLNGPVAPTARGGGALPASSAARQPAKPARAPLRSSRLAARKKSAAKSASPPAG